MIRTPMSPSNLSDIDMKIFKPFLVPTENVVCLDSPRECFPNASSQIRLSGTATQFQYELQREEISADVKNITRTGSGLSLHVGLVIDFCTIMKIYITILALLISTPI